MRNWSTDTSKMNKKSEQYQIWKHENLINFGLTDEKLDTQFLETNLDILQIEDDSKRYIKFLLNG